MDAKYINPVTWAEETVSAGRRKILSAQNGGMDTIDAAMTADRARRTGMRLV